MVQGHGRAARDDAQDTVEEGGRKGLTLAARAGYAARGFVYLVVGALALMAAVGGSFAGASGQTTGARGAIQTILGMPGGTWLVALTAVGLFGYALWRLVQGGLDADGHGTDAKGLVIRAGLIGSAIIHIGLAYYAGSIVWGWSGGGGSGGGQGMTAQLMAQPFGRWLVGLLGVAAWGAAVAQVGKAAKKGYRKWLDSRVQQADWLDPVSRFGLGAKALVMAMIGSFLIVAAFTADSSEAGGLPMALATLQQQAYGPWLLGLVAAGLIAFGLYGLVEARHRIIPQPT